MVGAEEPRDMKAAAGGWGLAWVGNLGGGCTIPKAEAHRAPSLPEKHTGPAVGFGGTDSGPVWVL